MATSSFNRLYSTFLNGKNDEYGEKDGRLTADLFFWFSKIGEIRMWWDLAWHSRKHNEFRRDTIWNFAWQGRTGIE